MKHPTKALILLAALVTLAAAMPASADRGSRGHRGHHRGYGHRQHGSWSFSLGLWSSPYYWGRPFYYPAYTYSPAAVIYEPTVVNADRAPFSSIETDVKPSSAVVYLDGSPVGIADDFDGWPSKLRVPPGSHELVFREEGYQALRVNVQALPYHSVKIKQRMQPGVDDEPVPEARSRDDRSAIPRNGSATMSEGRFDRGRPAVLTLDVTPADATVYLDGRKTGEPGTSTYAFDLTPGSHRVEVVKPGYQVFAGEIVAQEGQQQEMSVRLVPARGSGRGEAGR